MFTPGYQRVTLVINHLNIPPARLGVEVGNLYQQKPQQAARFVGCAEGEDVNLSVDFEHYDITLTITANNTTKFEKI
jgi:hypothetical protein